MTYNTIGIERGKALILVRGAMMLLPFPSVPPSYQNSRPPMSPRTILDILHAT
jgi:hypothetical protein